MATDPISVVPILPTIAVSTKPSKGIEMFDKIIGIAMNKIALVSDSKLLFIFNFS